MRKQSDAGFTLAETLVAMALTAMVIGAAIETFNRAIGLFGTSRTVSETDETLQAAMSLMVRDFIQTGRGVPLGGIPIPSGNGSVPVLRPGPGNLDFGALTTVPAISPGGNLGPAVIGPQTDLVNLLYADQTLNLSQYPLAAISANGQTITVDNRTNIGGAAGLHVGDLILFSNAFGSALGMVTDLPGGQDVTLGPGDPMLLNQPNAPQGTILNLQQAPGVYPPTSATRVWMISYYIDNTTDPTLPRLVRQINDGAPLAIALGAENLQLSYDFIDGVNNPVNQKNTPVGNSPNQIRKVNLFLGTRSLDMNVRTGDYFRNSMATEIGLRSLTFRNRYQ
ncbi:MAG TPA: prepilin-type N-terminal cleavage/methylation domain-containing protein [Vicinamibacterales bacterium]|nr:prepilin-type N-terminal cleavage/methylation domain-containing protein [Vicinamibacterales bacterium]